MKANLHWLRAIVLHEPFVLHGIIFYQTNEFRIQQLFEGKCQNLIFGLGFNRFRTDKCYWSLCISSWIKYKKWIQPHWIILVFYGNLYTMDYTIAKLYWEKCIDELSTLFEFLNHYSFGSSANGY